MPRRSGAGAAARPAPSPSCSARFLSDAAHVNAARNSRAPLLSGHADGCTRVEQWQEQQGRRGTSWMASGGRGPERAHDLTRHRWWAREPRIGEAANPGPPAVAATAPRLRRRPTPEATAVAYPALDRHGFRDYTAPGFAKDPAAARRDEQFQLRVETFNSTGWSALQRRLQSTTVHILLAQETWVLQGAVPAASQWARRCGWKSLWSPAEPGAGGGPSAGVAIFVREHFGLRYPSVGPHEWRSARAVAGVVEVPSFRPFLVASAYLRHGQGPSRKNVELLGDIGAGIEAQGDGMQVVDGGDFNMDLADLLLTGFDRRLRAMVLHPPTERGTFRTTRAATTLDDFAVTDTLAAAVDQITTVEGTDAKGHVLVAILFKPRASALRALHLRRPPELERERVFGPLPPPPDPTAAAEAADAALAAATMGALDAQLCIDRAYARWANLAEEELQQYAGKAVKKPGERAKLPRVVWRSVLPERTPDPRYPRAAALTWLRGVLGELIRIGAAADSARVADHDPQDGGPPPDPRHRRTDDDGQDGAPHPAGARGSEPNIVEVDHARTDADDSAAERRSRRPPSDIARCRAAVADIVTSLSEDAPGGRPAEGVERYHAAVADLAADMLNAMSIGAEEVRPRGHWCDVPAGFLARCAATAAAAREDIDAEAKRADADRRAGANAAWKAWISEGIEAGASRAHAYTKAPIQWEPTTATDVGGAISCAPDALLGAQRDKYRALWKPVTQPFRYENIGGDELPVQQPEAIRSAAMSFAWRTTQTYDGFHPRQIGLLSDAALRVLANMLQAVEVAGVLVPSGEPRRGRVAA